MQYHSNKKGYFLQEKTDIFLRKGDFFFIMKHYPGKLKESKNKWSDSKAPEQKD